MKSLITLVSVNRCLRLWLTGALISSLALSTVYAEPTVTVTNPSTGQPVNSAATTSPTAAATNQTTNQATNTNAAINTGATTNPDGSPATSLNNPNSLAAQLQPTDSALSAANQELLSRNAALQRQVNDLQTQVNVLIYESKGQLFLYGAFTVVIGILVGIFIAWLVFVKRQRW